VRIVFAGGGTGGHLFPGVALAQAIVRRDPSAEPFFLCTERPIDARHLSRYGLPYRVLPGQRLQGLRKSGVAAFPALMRAYHSAWKNVERLAPSAMVGLGGYAMVGPALAAAWFGIPLVLLEQNVVPGKAVRFCSRFARKICGQWDVTGPRFRRRPDLYEATGNPLRAEMIPIPREQALREVELSPEKRTLLVMGGSQGASGVDRVILQHGEALKDLAARVQVVHLCGGDNEANVRAKYAALGVTARVFPFFERMPVLYSAADMALARAGGTAIAEMCFFGVPMVLVPLPHAADNHQFRNALEIAKHKGGFVQAERDWNPGWFKNYLDTLLLDDRRRTEFSRHARSLSRPQAAERVANIVLQLAASHRTPQGALA